LSKIFGVPEFQLAQVPAHNVSKLMPEIPNALVDLNSHNHTLIKPKGILGIWQVMKAILLRARKEKLIPFDPFENIQRPKQDLRQNSFWIRDEITQFL